MANPGLSRLTCMKGSRQAYDVVVGDGAIQQLAKASLLSMTGSNCLDFDVHFLNVMIS